MKASIDAVISENGKSLGKPPYALLESKSRIHGCIPHACKKMVPAGLCLSPRAPLPCRCGRNRTSDGMRTQSALQALSMPRPRPANPENGTSKGRAGRDASPSWRLARAYDTRALSAANYCFSGCYSSTRRWTGSATCAMFVRHRYGASDLPGLSHHSLCRNKLSQNLDGLGTEGAVPRPEFLSLSPLV